MATDVLTNAVRGLVREREDLAKTIQRCAVRCDELRGRMDEVEAERDQARIRIREIDEALLPLRNLAPTARPERPRRKNRPKGSVEGLILGHLEDGQVWSRIRIAGAVNIDHTCIGRYIDHLLAAGAVERVSRGSYRKAGLPVVRVA